MNSQDVDQVVHSGAEEYEAEVQEAAAENYFRSFEDSLAQTLLGTFLGLGGLLAFHHCSFRTYFQTIITYLKSCTISC